MIYLTIDGNTNLKTPATMQIDLQDIHGSETGRVQDGDMFLDRIAGGKRAKRKINCTWTGLTMSEISALLQAMEKESFDICYPDPYVGDFRTATVYVGDRSAPIFRTGAQQADDIVWETLSANFIEL